MQSGRAKARLMREPGRKPRQTKRLPEIENPSSQPRTHGCDRRVYAVAPVFFCATEREQPPRRKKAMATQSLAQTSELSSQVLEKMNPFELIQQRDPAKESTE